MDRREFLQLLGKAGVNGAAFVACSEYMSEVLTGSSLISEAVAQSANMGPGSLKDIEHVVILMQENRSFDHYYGTLRGVRGFGDPRPLMQNVDVDIFHQFINGESGEGVLPYEFSKQDAINKLQSAKTSAEYKEKSLKKAQDDYNFFERQLSNPKLTGRERTELQGKHSKADAEVKQYTSAFGYATELVKVLETRGKSAGSYFVEDPKHDHGTGIQAFNNGRYNKWIEAKDKIAMAYYTEKDIPFYFQLAKNFTICDAYYCSYHGETDPNRAYLFTGTARGWNFNAHFSAKPFLETIPILPLILPLRNEDWETYPERLSKALGKPPKQVGKQYQDWKVYQDGIGCTADPFKGNYGDTVLACFGQYSGWTALPGAPLTSGMDAPRLRDTANPELRKKALSVNSVLSRDGKPSQFAEDVKNDALPRVSWISSPEAYCEHPIFPPHFGEFYVHEILKALVSNPDVWRKTVFLINYDENGGFFDHMVPPTPPVGVGSARNGSATSGIVVNGNETYSSTPTKLELKPKTTSTTIGLEKQYFEEADKIKRAMAAYNESIANIEEPRFAPFLKQDLGSHVPMGLGPRVPLLVISPWSVGGRVCSETFDHTSVIGFIETWLTAKGYDANELKCKHISSWRRAICGDLTSTLDFSGSAKTDDGTKAAETTLKAMPDYSRTGEKVFKQASRTVYDHARDLRTDHIQANILQPHDRCEILPLAYNFKVLANRNIDVASPGLQLLFQNEGELGAAFNVYSYTNDVSSKDGPWSLAVEGKKNGGDVRERVLNFFMPLYNKEHTYRERYHYAVHGPNGYLAEFYGTLASKGAAEVQCEVSDIVPVTDKSKIDNTKLTFKFDGDVKKARLKAVNAYTAEIIDVEQDQIDVATIDGWYDVSFVSTLPGAEHFRRRFAGHIENGEKSWSDPAIGFRYQEKTFRYGGSKTVAELMEKPKPAGDVKLSKAQFID